jgi:hypothetical protein
MKLDVIANAAAKGTRGVLDNGQTQGISLNFTASSDRRTY